MALPIGTRGEHASHGRVRLTKNGSGVAHGVEHRCFQNNNDLKSRYSNVSRVESMMWIMKQIKRTKIAEALQLKNFGDEVNVKGWVRTRRGNKNVVFIALKDGSTIHNIQVVLDIAAFAE